MTKMAVLHIITHDDSHLKEDCAIWLTLVADHHNAVVLQEPEEFLPAAFYLTHQEKRLANPAVFYQRTLQTYHLFSRSPPVGGITHSDFIFKRNPKNLIST
ncbi:hypothetical protein [Leeuwenhoekiella marinoflava]|uniref:Uncharacterized protein n=2 Tax=Leeuwenhoekiella marinoflava TaxID=988 RepID=A0A4Q0P1V4_9FLAO|nr:hypothetical protein [Leeuwenhoekiella marinoflava]RXG20427.1 hypothetical protein DSL99_4119 [Leeuwenhoekiella marinoflava]SHG07577.1 hypothetical protein SAMN02745246_04125 [Leeuwenhoekiella marinoflava DSM 3653]